MIPPNPQKNLAGNDVSIFLFRFAIRGVGIDFVINEGIAADMYQDINEKLAPLVHACSETILRYKHLSKTPEIMDGNVLMTGEFEVMLSRGLGRYFPVTEKQELFNDAKKIADLLVEVMDRRTKEEKNETLRTTDDPSRKPDPAKLKKGLQQLGEDKRLRDQARWAFEGKRGRPSLKRLRPEDIPPGITASQGYDQRGHCLMFEHETLGELGKIVLIKISEGQMTIQAELHVGGEDPEIPSAEQKRQLFEQVVAVVNGGFQKNFPE